MNKQEIEGITAAEANADNRFRKSFEKTVARMLNNSDLSINVSSVQDSTIRRALLASKVIVQYIVTLNSTSIDTITSKISNSVQSGSFTSALIRELVLVSYPTTGVSASTVPEYVDITPTGTPTRAPTMKPSKYVSAMPTNTPKILLSQVT